MVFKFASLNEFSSSSFTNSFKLEVDFLLEINIASLVSTITISLKPSPTTSLFSLLIYEFSTSFRNIFPFIEFLFSSFFASSQILCQLPISFHPASNLQTVPSLVFSKTALSIDKLGHFSKYSLFNR